MSEAGKKVHMLNALLFSPTAASKNMRVTPPPPRPSFHSSVVK